MPRTPTPELPALRIDCPHCHSPRHRVTATRRRAGKPLRYHVCQRCGGKFKTYEISERDLIERLRAGFARAARRENRRDAETPREERPAQ